MELTSTSGPAEHSVGVVGEVLEDGHQLKALSMEGPVERLLPDRGLSMSLAVSTTVLCPGLQTQRERTQDRAAQLSKKKIYIYGDLDSDTYSISFLERL